MTRPIVLRWLDEAPVYQAAVERAGLADRVEFHGLRTGEEPAPDLLARADALLTWRLRRGASARMPRLRWVQALTASVEGWLARPDLQHPSRINDLPPRPDCCHPTRLLLGSQR